MTAILSIPHRLHHHLLTTYLKLGCIYIASLQQETMEDQQVLRTRLSLLLVLLSSSCLLAPNSSCVAEATTLFGNETDRLALLAFKELRCLLSPTRNLTYCSELRTLDVATNHLVGNIPASINSLSKLEILNLGHNGLAGVIPPSIGNLTSLLELHLRKNHLDGTIPDDIGHLTKLEAFDAADNNLMGRVPSSFYNISSIVLFNVAVNNLQGSLPLDLGTTLPNLRALLLGMNQFHGPIPASLANASGFKFIDISQNNFSGKVPSDLGRLAELYNLNLEKNQLEAREHKDWEFLNSLTNCSNLQTLELNNNMLGGMLPISVANLSSQLKELSMEANQISGILPSGIGNLVSLNKLSFSANLLTGDIPESIGKLTRLQGLDLSRNVFTKQIPSSLRNLTQLSRLALDNNKLEGSIPPSLGDLQNLQSLSLSNNHLSGTIPKEIVSLPSLSLSLDLSHNSLVGSLPLEVGGLKNLYMLNISRNMLTGVIPQTLSNCEILEYLDMSNNLFQGAIPISLSNVKGLRELDLSHNNLSGPFPEFLADLNVLENLNLSFNHLEGEVPVKGVFTSGTQVSVNGNDGLCGGVPELHLPACPTGSFKKKRWPLLLKIMIPVACLVICLVLLSAFVILRWKWRSGKNAPTVCPLEDQFPRVSYNELVKATDGFSSTNLIGKGAYGSVYKGTLEPQQIVAVKVFNLQHQGASKSFLAECEALKSIRHRNLVKILTACSKVDFKGNDFKALIFEFIPNGSLKKWLHPKLDGHHHSESLSILQRLNVAVDVADAVDYLHNSCQPSVVHCDLKPGNILLDNEMIAYVGDFGLARFIYKASECSFTHKSNSSLLKGSIGYIAPEYGVGGQVSTSGDVYSYGILLLEMLTGKCPVDEMFNDSLSLWKFVEMAFPDRIMEIMDPLMPLGEDDQVITQECLVSMAKIGLSCSNQSARERMSMNDVARKMHAIKDTYLRARIH